MKRFLLAIFLLPSVSSATVIISSNSVIEINNPFLRTGYQYITSIDTTSIQAGANITVVATSSGVQIASTGGGGGSGSLAVYKNNTQVLTGVSTMNFTNDFNTAAAGSSVTVSLSGNATSYIRNQNTLQSGSTFYVSSGTVEGTGINTVFYLRSQNGTTTPGTEIFSVHNSSTNGTFAKEIPIALYANNGSGTPVKYALISGYANNLNAGNENGGIRFYVQQGGSLDTTATLDVSDQFGVRINTFTEILNGQQLKFDGSSGGFVGLQAPASPGSITFTLPGSDGSNGQALTTNGSKVLSFTTISGGSGYSVSVASGLSAGFNALVSSPVYTINFSSQAFGVSLQGGATAFIIPLPSSVTLQGNSFNGANQLVQLNSSTQYPGLDGSLILRVSSITEVTTHGQGGSATIVPVITFNDQGQITSISSATISASGGGGSLAVYLNNSQIATGVSTMNFTNSFSVTTAGSSVTVQMGGTTFTQGQVLYTSTNGITAGTNNFYWDAANNRLGISTNSPSNDLTFGSGSTSNTTQVSTRTIAVSNAPVDKAGTGLTLTGGNGGNESGTGPGSGGPARLIGGNSGSASSVNGTPGYAEIGGGVGSAIAGGVTGGYVYIYGGAKAGGGTATTGNILLGVVPTGKNGVGGTVQINNVGIGTLAPATMLHMSSGAFTLDGNNSQIIATTATFSGPLTANATFTVSVPTISLNGTIYYWKAGQGTNGYVLTTDGGNPGTLTWSNNLPPGSTNYIQNTTSIQAGSEYFVSTGVVNSSFTTNGSHQYNSVSTMSYTNSSSFLYGQTALVNASSIFQIGNSTTIALSGNGHFEFHQSTVPSVSSCGAGASLGPNSTDHSGYIETGSGITACTLTFANAFTNTANCTASTNGSGAFAFISTPGASSTIFGLSASFTGNIYYNCFGNQ